MNRYEELEKLYYKKLYTKIFLWLLGIGVGVGGIVYLYNIFTKKEIKKEKVAIKEPKKVVKELKESNKQEIKATKKDSINKEKNITSHKSKDILKIKFVLPHIKASVKESKKPVLNPKQPQKTYPHSSKNPQQIKKVENKPIVKKDKFVLKEKEVSLKELINKFHKNPDVNLALIIARKYLNENNLTKAQQWSLKANNLQPQNPDSWILFADIFIKKKNIKKAKEILKFYLDSYGKNDKIENKLRSINDK